MKRISGWIAAAAAIGLATAAHAETVKVGLISSFSGGFAIWGQQFQQAVEAFQAVNGKSVKGNEVQVLYRDTSGADPAKSKQLAEELILREKVKFLAGFEFTPNALAVADLVTEAKVPTIIMNAATAVIVRNSPMYVRVSMTLPQQTAPLATWAFGNGIKKVYTVVADYGPGKDAEEQFVKSFKAAGGEIVKSEKTPLNTADFAPYMENVLQAKPDAVFVFQPAGPPSIAIIDMWSKRGLKAAGIKLLATGETQEIFLPALGEGAVGAYSSQHYSLDLDNPENKALQKALTDKFGPKAIPDIASVAAWDGMRLIYDALAELGPAADGDKIVAYMKGRKLNSPRGPIMIDPDTRDIVQNMYIRQVVKEGDRLINKTIAKVDAVKDPWKIDNPPK